MNKDNLLAMPTHEVDVQTLIGKRVRYLDKEGKSWPGVITGAEDPFVIVKFELFPSGLGQSQLLDIYEDSDPVE